MVPQEFYIRNATENEARGPYNLDQVTSLAEAGQVTAETLYYDAASEQWVAIGADPDVKVAVFPEKKKLSIKKEHKIATLNVEKEGDAPIEVTDMLAAAEGKSHDTKDKSAAATAMERCAKIGTWTAVAGLLLAAVGELLPSAAIFTAFEPKLLLAHPLVILGVVDIGLALLLMLGVIAIYPFVRFRAALGAGLVGGMIYLSQGNPTVMLAVIAGSVGVYCATIFVTYVPTFISTALAICGMGGFAWFMLSS